MRLALGVILAALGFVHLPAETQAAEPPVDPLAETRRLLTTPVDVAFDETPLGQALGILSRKIPALDITVDASALDEFPDLSRQTVNVEVRQVAAGEVLKLVLGEGPILDLRSDGVHITGPQTYWATLRSKWYPLADLLTPPFHKGRRPQLQWAEFLDIVVRHVDNMADRHVAPWQDEGGSAAIEYQAGSLLVRQTREGHEQTARLMALLRYGMGLTAEAPPCEQTPADREAAERVRRLLKRKIDLDFRDTTLKEMLRHLTATQRDLSLAVDPDLRRADAILERQVESLEVKEIAIASALRLILGPDLSYQIGPGYVLLTGDRTFQGDMFTALYRVRDLCGPYRQGGRFGYPEEYWQELIDLLKREVHWYVDPPVKPWTDEGGAASLDYFQGLLIVRQTDEGHRQIEEYLGQMRTALALALQLPKQPQGPVLAVTGPEPFVPDAIYRALETPIDADFEDTPISAALQYVAAWEPPLKIVMDPCPPVGSVWFHLALSAQTSLQVKGMPRAILLKRLLGKKLSYEVYPDFVLVTSLSQGWNRLPLQRILYVVPDLTNYGAYDHPRDLIDAICSEVNHRDDPRVEAWTDEGGPAQIEWFRGVLVVSQSPPAHKRIAELLNRLRQASGVRIQSRRPG
jgi:hypothetical protein